MSLILWTVEEPTPTRFPMAWTPCSPSA